MNREGSSGQGEWDRRRRRQGRDDFEPLLASFGQGFDGVVQYCRDGHVYRFCFAEDMTSVSVFDVSLKDAGW